MTNTGKQIKKLVRMGAKLKLAKRRFDAKNAKRAKRGKAPLPSALDPRLAYRSQRYMHTWRKVKALDDEADRVVEKGKGRRGALFAFVTFKRQPVSLQLTLPLST